MDKNKAIVDFIMQCPYIQSNPLFYNFGKVEADNKQLITLANDIRTNTAFIDGSVKKRYTFTIIDYKSVSNVALVNREGAVNENIETAFEAQQLIDWVEEQAEAYNYPDFGEDCTVEDMKVVTDQPNLNGIDRAVTPALAKYSISIRIDYIDYSKTVWK